MAMKIDTARVLASMLKTTAMTVAGIQRIATFGGARQSTLNELQRLCALMREVADMIESDHE